MTGNALGRDLGIYLFLRLGTLGPRLDGVDAPNEPAGAGPSDGV